MRTYLAISCQLSVVSLVIAGALILSSCSKLQSDVLTPVQSQSVIHPAGWATPSSADFHGIYIKNHNYDLTICTSCHGNDLNGGTSEIRCYECHQGSNGTLACNTCHGNSANSAPPKDLSGDSLTLDLGVGAHQSHLAGNEVFDGVACSSCHLVPQAAGPGLHPSGGKPTVLFESLALAQTNVSGSQYYDDSMTTIVPSPVFNSQTLQCSNTYCHGDFKGGNDFSPKWNVVDGSQDSCGTCHGLPPHGSINGIVPFYKGADEQNCYFCHEPMMGQTGIQDSSLHVDGKLELYGSSRASW